MRPLVMLGLVTDYPHPEAAPRKVRGDKGVGTKITPVLIRAITRRMTNNRFLTANELREKVPGLSSVSTHRVNQVLRIAGVQVWCYCEETFPDWGSEGEKAQVGLGSQDLNQEEVEEGSLV